MILRCDSFLKGQAFMKENIKREDIHYNFLKNIIIRFDYDGMDEPELDVVLPEISSRLKEKGYVSRTKEICKGMEFNIDDPERIEVDGLAVRNVTQQRVFIFHNQNKQVELKISSTFAFISINKTKYVNCLEYCDVLLDVMRIIKRKVTYFNCRRFGLRKINQCFLTDITKLNDFFEREHFRVYCFGEESKPKVTQLKDSFFVKDYNVNLARTIVCGEMDGKEAYQVVFDSDIYVLGDENVSLLLLNEKKVSDMNEVLFELYKDIITEPFLQQLVDGTFDAQVIKEVEKNE